MNQLSKKLKKKVRITNELGLHARPAAVIAKIVKDAKSNVWLVMDDHKLFH